MKKEFCAVKNTSKCASQEKEIANVTSLYKQYLLSSWILKLLH